MQIIKRPGLVVLMAFALASGANAQIQPKSGSTSQHLIIEDSSTNGKTLLKKYITELRDSLNHVSSLQASLQRNRASGTKSVFVSQGRQLARNCTLGAAMADLTTERIAPMHTSDTRGEQALQAYRSGLARLSEELRGCAHFDSLTIAAATLDQEKLENIATAASDSINRYDEIRDGLLKLLGIYLPVKGKIYH